MNTQNADTLLDKPKKYKNLLRRRTSKLTSAIHDFIWLDDINELIKSYCIYMQRSGKSQNTIKSYCQAVRLFVRFIAGSRGEYKPLRFFNPVDLLLFQIYMKNERGCRENTIRTRMVALASYSDYLVATGLLADNPVKTLRQIMKTGAGKTVYRDEDHLRLTRRLQKQRFTPRLLRNLLITELILSAGLNAAEISRLNMGDVLWRGDHPSALVVWSGRKPRLILVRDKFLRQLLDLYLVIRKLQTGSRLIKGRSGEERGFCASSISRMFKAQWKKAELGECKVPYCNQPASAATWIPIDLSDVAA
ncbi:MAG: phage integrase N-terminal SAM-like domain-containing protein [Syntrophomonas sp.]